MYKEIEVFESYCGYTKAHVCEGAARDRAKYGDGRIYKSRFLYTGDLEDGCKIYRAIGAGSANAASWFMSREEAVDAAQRLGISGDFNVETAVLDLSQIEPISFPLEVVFLPGKDGRPYVKLNLHPELNGEDSRKKVYFPDKSMVGADVGEAIITSVKEFDKFGFLKGEMVKKKMPEDMADFLDWAWEHMAPDDVIYFINHPGRGKYLATSDDYYIEETTEERRYSKMFNWVYDDRKKYCEKEIALEELYISRAFEGETMSSMLAKFHESMYVMQHSQFQGCHWQRSEKYYSDLVDEAIEDGIFRPMALSGTSINTLICIRCCMYKLATYTEEEVKELSETFSRVNQEADDAISAKIRKGKLRLV